MLYPILNGKIDIQWPKINNVTFNYDVSDKKYHEVAGIDFTHNSDNNDALFDMINGVLNDDTIIKCNVIYLWPLYINLTI